MNSRLLAKINNSMIKLFFASGFISGFCFVLVYCVKRNIICKKFQSFLKKRCIDWGRFLGGIFSFFLGILFLAIFIIENFFDLSYIEYPSFFWVLAWSFIAFAIRAFKAMRESSTIPAWKCYPTYFIILFIISSLVFAILHISETTSNYLFYFFSWPIVLYLSYNIDYIEYLLFKKSPLDILERIIKIIKG